MRIKNLLTTFTAAMLLFGAIGSAQAAAVSITGADDSNDDPLLFDPSANGVPTDGAMMSSIDLGLNMFKAETDNIMTPQQSFDTMFLDIAAPAGYVITAVQYTETVDWEIANGFVLGDGSLEVNGQTEGLNGTIFFLSNGADSGTTSFTTDMISLDNVDSIDVTVTNSLVAALIGTAQVNTPGGLVDPRAYIEKTEARLDVYFAPVPLPPAVWLLGSAIAGLMAVRRKTAGVS